MLYTVRMLHLAPGCLRGARVIPRAWSHSKCFSKLSTSTDHGDDVDFGDYSLILPPEPYVFGVSHIVPRSVPSSIVKPHYTLDLDAPSTDKDDQKIILGGNSEVLIRRVAKLAKTVREYAGKLVQVRLAILSEGEGYIMIAGLPRLESRQTVLTRQYTSSFSRILLTLPRFSILITPARVVLGMSQPGSANSGTLVLIMARSVNNIIAHGIPDE
jgi:hypothetical protein